MATLTLEPTELDRDAPETPRPNVEPPGTEPGAPGLPPGTPPASVTPFQRFAETALADAARERERAGERLKSTMAARDAALAPRLEATEAALETRRRQIEATPPPEPPTLAPPPSRGLHDFLAPVEGEAPLTSLTKLLTGMGVLATGASGLVRGNARVGLAAMRGALQGWAEGDRERADREFTTWQASTDTAIKQHALDMSTYKAIIENGNLSTQQMLDAVKLNAQRLGLPVESAAWAVQDADAVVKFYGDQQRHADELARQWQVIIDARAKADADRAQRAEAAKEATAQRAEAARQRSEDLRMADITRRDLAAQSERTRRDLATMSDETKRAIAESNRLAAEAARRDREAFQRQMRDERLAPGTWFDRETGEKAEPTLGDIRENPEKYKRSNQQGETRWEQITIAKPMLKRLRTLADRLLAEQSPGNLVKAAELYAQGKMVSNPDLREWGALVEDVNVKMTSVMGPGQFRVTLFNVLRDVGLHTKDTRASANRILDQWETNIDNDLRAITGQKLREHLSGPWQGWALSPTGERKWVRIPPGERIDPGWITVEETPVPKGKK